MAKRATVLAAGVLVSLTAVGYARPPLWATVPAGFADAVFASGLTAPVAMEFAPDGRLFVCEKGGSLRVITPSGTLLASPFMTLTVETGGERGLLGIAFDPQFATNGFLYVYYTVGGAAPRNRLSRFTANGDQVVGGSEVPLVDLDAAPSMFHNGGAIHFGPDGKLYVAVGDGGPSPNGQLITNRFGKILRLNADGTIPTDNPTSFPGITGTTAGANRAIWCVGLRNPFTFAFQPGAGRMFINDVGNQTWEEVNEGLAGSNYGWPTTEGTFDPAAFPNFRLPTHTYGHDGTARGPAAGEAVVGATFYPAGGTFPAAYHGLYFFADLTNGWIRTLDPANGTTALFAEALSNPVDLKAGPDGGLYYLSHTSGQVGRITYTVAGTPPAITLQPSDRTVSVGQSASFQVSASGSAPLGCQWQRNGSDLPGATSADYTLANAQLADSGAQFRCVVSNAFGSAASAAATLTVTSNQPPVATIVTPGAGTAYQAGDTVLYSGTAADAEDGALSGAAFTWRVDFHHGTHFHPFVPDASGSANGLFVIPTTGETSTDVWYRITLTVTDSAGLTHTVTRDVLPVVVTLTLETDPPGLQVTLDGQPQTAPYVTQAVAGMTRTLVAVAGQSLAGTLYVFASWSDGGAETHAIATPSSGGTYRATYGTASAGSGGGCGFTGQEAVLLVGLLGLLRRLMR